MPDKRWRVFGGLAIAFFATAVLAEPAATRPSASESAWSQPSNGLRARLSMRRSSVCNGTGIVTTYLELNNVSDIGSPMLVNGHPLKFTVTDGGGHKVPQSGGAFDGMEPSGTLELVLPNDSLIRFPIGPCGWGVPGDQAALLDLGPQDGWVLPRNGKQYFLQAVMEIAGVKEDRTERGIRWHGRLELPPVRIPTESEPIDPAVIGPIIDDLGTKMLAKDGRVSEPAMSELSLIDDPRVIRWYVAAMKTDSYDLKFNALDRLSRFADDDALAGLKIGMTTQGKDIGNCTTATVAAQMAQNIRHSATIALARSPNPKAKALLWTMEEDPATAVRITVVQSAAQMDTPESLALLKRRTHDSDPTVRGEAERLLKLRENGNVK